jgi:hypothetical protein
MSPVNIFITISLAVAIAIPLAMLINRVDRWWKFRKIITAMERVKGNKSGFRFKDWKEYPNVEIADGFKLHERPQNVTSMSARNRRQLRGPYG